MWVYNSKNQTLTGKLEIRSKNVKESISQLRKKKKKKRIKGVANQKVIHGRREVEKIPEQSRLQTSNIDDSWLARKNMYFSRFLFFFVPCD